MPAISDPTTPPGEISPLAAMAELFTEHRANPYRGFQRWRERRPIAQLDPQHVVVSRHSDAQQVLNDPAFGHPEPKVITNANDRSPDEPVYPDGRVVRAFFSLNPPDHARLRRLVAKAFTARTIERLTPNIMNLTDELITRTLDAGEANLMEAIARPIPFTVISDLLGVPLADRERFAGWTRAVMRATDLDALQPRDVREPATAAKREFMEYFRTLADERRSAPCDDLLSELVAISDGGEKLTEDELLVTLKMLLIAGHETTVNLIGNGVLALLEHRDQLRALAADPSLADRAVEEILRYDSPVQLTARTALVDTAIGDVPVAVGTTVVVLIGAANRDPAAYQDANVFDINRGSSKHLAFGHGIHFCLGAPLARLEGRIVLGELARRAPRLRLAGEPRWDSTITIRGLTQLPVATT